LSGAKAEIIDNKIRITSTAIGINSKISIADGATNGLIAKINTLTDMTCTVETAIDGNNLSSEKLTIGFRELPRCENKNIIVEVK
jgi:hypothetical protein